MARRSQCSSAGDNPLDPNYLPPHYREEYRLAIDALVEEDLEGYYDFLQSADVVDFLSTQEIEHIKHTTQEPQQSCTQPESPHLETRGDGSSDTYWPLHSDLDAPGLDLGWPPQHRFIGPTEVTTLVNPSEPDMPSIKEQARRLIKNAQQVVAVVMDIFTDVDIFADILDAARRNVAVYLLLDEQNVHHFTNMVSSCRVNLMHIPFMRVRTVSGLTYYCRSGKSFKGQMMDRFLLTDCRAVLSGNYSFMWSFEKIHRCIAHLFLGQLVTTFDEEFRILFAQSQPLILEVAPAPKPMFSSMSDRQYSTDRITAPKQGIVPLFRDPRKFLERARHSFEERVDMDHRRMPLGKHQLIHRSLDQGQLEMYGDQYSSQQVRMDPSVIEQGHHMMPPNTMDSDAFKRHSYAEGLPSYQFTQPQHQAMQRFETQGRQLHREQLREQPPSHRAGPHPDYGGYEFRGCGYPTMGQYSEAEYPQDMEPDSYDHVLNYLASTSAAEMDDISDKVATDEVPFDQRSAGEPYAHQNSQIQQNSPEQKLFFQAPSKEHSKDLSGKMGLRDWRISSYLSALDDTGEEGLPAEPCGTEAFEEPPQPLFNLSQGKPLSAVPADNRFRTKELPKILTVPRMSHLHCYNKPIVPGHIKTLPVDIVTMETEPKITPTSASESSSTTEDDKTEEMEAKEPKGVQRQDSFRKRYNAAVQRSSRLRSSLIFSSQLEQNFSLESENTPDERTAKNEDDQSKLSFTSHLLGKHRSIAREPFEWSRYVKSAAADGTTAESSNSDDLVHDAGVKELQKSHPVVKHIKEQPKPVEAEQTEVSPSVHPATQSQDNQLKTIQPTHQELVSWTSFLDMNDPDNRLMFFRELAAQRKAAKADELERSAEKAHMKPDLSVTPSEPNVPASVPATSTDPERKPATTLPSQEVKSNMSMPTSHRNVTEQASSCEELDLNPPREECEAEPLLDCHVCSNEGAGSGSTDAEKIELKKSQSGKAQMKQDPATPDMPSEDCSLIDLKESDVSKSTLNRTSEREYRPPSCSETSSPTNAPSETSPLPPHLSTQEPSPASPATMKSNSSHPLTSSGALLSPTPKDSSSDNKGSSIGLNPALKDSSSSIPISNEELVPSKPAELIDNAQTMSSTSSGSSSATYPSPSEAPASPTPVPSATSSSPQPVPSVLSPQTILSELNSSQAVPSESGSTTPTGPIQSSLSLGPNKLAFPSKPEENEANKSHKSPPRTNSGESSPPKPASDEIIVSLEPPETEPPLTSPPPAAMESETSSSLQSIQSESVTSPVLSEPSSSKTAPSEPSPITSTITQQSKSNESHSPSPTSLSTEIKRGESSIGEPGQVDSVLSYKPPQTESSCSSQPNPMESTSSNLSLSSSNDVTDESYICPRPCQEDTSSPLNPIRTESCSSPKLGPDQSVLLIEPEKASNLSLSSSNDVTDESNIFPSPCQEDTSSPLNPITTESCSSPKLGPDQSVLLTEPEKDKPVTSPCQEDTSSPLNPIITESCSSPKLGPDQSVLLNEPEKDEPVTSSCQEDTSSPLNPITTESCSSPKLGPDQAVLLTEPEKDESVTFPNFSPEPSSEKNPPSPDLTSESDDPPKTDPTSLTAEEVCTSSVSGSDSVSLVSPKSDKTEVVSTSPCPSSPSDKSTSLPEPTSAESSESFIPKSTELCSPSMHTLVECTSSVLTECNSRRVSSAEFITSEPPVSVEKSNEGTPADVSRESKPESSVLNGESKADEVEAKETANKAPEESGCHGSQSDETKMSSSTMSPPESSPDQVSPLSPQSKNSKASPSRYASSTAKVISSSNLRDDTKLLLGQISANSQSRTELLKQSAVTDDDKEDETQKGDRGEGEALDRSQLKHRGRTPEERENLLQRIQSMRKERKVYSRFEMAP